MYAKKALVFQMASPAKRGRQNGGNSDGIHPPVTSVTLGTRLDLDHMCRWSERITYDARDTATNQSREGSVTPIVKARVRHRYRARGDLQRPYISCEESWFRRANNRSFQRSDGGAFVKLMRPRKWRGNMMQSEEWTVQLEVYARLNGAKGAKGCDAQ